MKRIIDKPYFTYSAATAITSKIYVKCPKCYGLGMVTADRDTAYFKCTSCGSSATKEHLHENCKK